MNLLWIDLSFWPEGFFVVSSVLTRLLLQDKWRVLNRRGAKKLQAALNKAKQDLKMVRSF